MSYQEPSADENAWANAGCVAYAVVPVMVALGAAKYGLLWIVVSGVAMIAAGALLLHHLQKTKPELPAITERERWDQAKAALHRISSRQHGAGCLVLLGVFLLLLAAVLWLGSQPGVGDWQYDDYGNEIRRPWWDP